MGKKKKAKQKRGHLTIRRDRPLGDVHEFGGKPARKLAAAVEFARSKSTPEKLAAAARGMQKIIGGFTFSAREMEQAFAKVRRLFRRAQHSIEVNYVLYGPAPHRSRIKTAGLRERLEQALDKRQGAVMRQRVRIEELEYDNRHLRCLLAPRGLAEAPVEYHSQNEQQELLVKARHEIARLEEQRAGNLVDLEHVKGYLRRIEERMAGKMPAPPTQGMAGRDSCPTGERR